MSRLQEIDARLDATAREVCELTENIVTPQVSALLDERAKLLEEKRRIIDSARVPVEELNDEQLSALQQALQGKRCPVCSVVHVSRQICALP